MNSIPLWAQCATIFFFLCLSAFFSGTETSMMALNRHRLKHLAKTGHRGAQNTQSLLTRTEELLSVILISNNLINTIVPVLTASIALRYFGTHEFALPIATALIAFLIIVFCEIAPKVIGATYPEKFAFPASYLIKPLMRFTRPVSFIINLLVTSLFSLFAINIHNQQKKQRISKEELRTIVLETGHIIHKKHRSILLNLFDLETIRIDDIMVPRTRIEAINFNLPLNTLTHQIETCYHNHLLIYQGDIDHVLGILNVRKILAAFRQQTLNHEVIKSLLTEPYFIPSDTAALHQLQFFQENQQRIGIVVDEYGEVEGLITPEDIIEELIGEFTTNVGHLGFERSGWSKTGECLVSGTATLRELNRRLGLNLPLNGPKTLNGLILEILQEIPEGNISMTIANCRMEILQIDHQSIKIVKLFRP